MKILICDDNEIILKKYKMILEGYLDAHNICFTLNLFSTPDRVLLFAKHNYIDLAFLDIELAGENGIELAKKLNYLQPGCQIVYLTNYLEYATEVYDTRHNAYVLKKQFPERVAQVMEKVLASMKRDEKKIAISDGKNMFLLLEKELVLVERCQRYTILHMENGEKYKTKEKLLEVEKLLDKKLFMRCHNSYLVSMMHIKQYRRNAVLLDNDTEITISRQYIKPVREQFLGFCDHMNLLA